MKCTRPHQTGMEKKWEEWVNATVNFLHANQVDTYEGGWNANSLEGMSRPKGKVMEIPQRLNLFQSAIDARRKMFRQKMTDLDEERAAHIATKNDLAIAHAMMEKIFIVWENGADNMESAAVMKDFELYVEEHLPHLVAEEEEADVG